VSRSSLVRILFVASVAGYPFVVYFGLQHLPPSFFGIFLLVILAFRYGVLLPAERQVLIPVLLVFAAYALAATLLQNKTMLLYYPALVNASLCAVFLNSLLLGDPILLRFIRARNWPISKYGPQYLYRLTAVWAGFFVVNGTISVWTSTISIEAWTAFNGFISYILIATLVGGEWLFRRHYKKRMGVENP
jgi:uncharacterized membrane protein